MIPKPTGRRNVWPISKSHPATGTLVPLAAFSHIERKAGALTVNQIGQLPSVSISYNLPQGVALGSTVDEMNKLKADLNWPDVCVDRLLWHNQNLPGFNRRPGLC